MKKQVLLIFVLFATGKICFSQEMPATEKQFYFFKTWNFVKYYHPSLAKGIVDADSLFFKMLPLIDKQQSKSQFNNLVRTFLKELSVSATNEKAKMPVGKTLRINTDGAWFSKSNIFDKEIKGALKTIYEYRYTDSIHHYVPDIRFSAEIPNEKEYKYPDTAGIPYHLRMLALAKLQGAVDYLFPHKYLMDESFDKTVKKYLPLFAGNTTRAGYETLLLKVTSAFDDTHSFKIFKQIKHKGEIFNSRFYPPFGYTVLNKEIVVTEIIVASVCKEADIKKGDIITAVNSKPVSKLVNDLSEMLAVSNRPTLLHYISKYLNNVVWQSTTPEFLLTVKRDKRKVSKKINFINPKEPESAKILNEYINSKYPAARSDNRLDTLPGSIAYIKIFDCFRFIENTPEQFIDKSMDSLLSIAANKKGIIFDMRGYPNWGGFVHTYIVKKFGRKPNRYAEYFEINKGAIGTYIFNNRDDTYNNTDIKNDGTPYQGKVVIIVNPETLSMSEWNTMNLQNVFPQSITIGEQSAGADGDEKSMNIPGGYKVNFTGNAIFYPDGTNAQRKGVKINRFIPLTRNAVLSDEDDLLEAAIKIINE